ncbi:MAG: hypothetical protein AAF202_02535, partial [Pseudomonadota bacterium]
MEEFVKVWIVNEEGTVLHSNTEKPLPYSWSEIPRSEVIHRLVERVDFFYIFPATEVMLLETSPRLFLVVLRQKGPPGGPFLGPKGLVLLTVVTMAFGFAILFVF